jgi:hypothetical protein
MQALHWLAVTIARPGRAGLPPDQDRRSRWAAATIREQCRIDRFDKDAPILLSRYSTERTDCGPAGIVDWN